MRRIVVIAKAPEPGRAKTRLCPPLTPEQAALLARAALRDTLDAAAAVPADSRVVALDGRPGPWLPAGFDVVPQRGDGLAERLAAAFEDAGTPALLIGMDTPQVTPELLEQGLAALEETGVDAVLGRAADGGFWAIGLRGPFQDVFRGVPMSTGQTGAAQAARLRALGLRHVELPPLADFDYLEDAVEVASQAPGSRFARTLRLVLATAAAQSPAPASPRRSARSL